MVLTILTIASVIMNFVLLYVVYNLAKLVKAESLYDFRNETVKSESKEEPSYID